MSRQWRSWPGLLAAMLAQIYYAADASPLVMAGGFDISRASPFRRAGEYGWSVRLPLAAPSDARLRPLRSATFARPTNPPVIAANAGYVFFHCAPQLRHIIGFAVML